VNPHSIHWKTLALLAPAALGILSMAWIFRIKTEPAAYGAQFALEPSNPKTIQPFLKKNCQTCHNADNPTSGVRVDNLDATLPDPHIRFWEAIKHRVQKGSMPPKGMPQPSPMRSPFNNCL
jgi:hypothetical protein